SASNTLQPASVTVTNSAGHDFTINTVTSGTKGFLTGNMSLKKEGTGTLFLATPNTYTGTTTIDGGKLVLTKDGAILPSAATTSAASKIVINPSGTFQFGNGDAAANASSAQLGSVPITNNGRFIINTTSGTDNPASPATITLNNVFTGNGTIEMNG